VVALFITTNFVALKRNVSCNGCDHPGRLVGLEAKEVDNRLVSLPNQRGAAEFVV
jgi:hypothetical protein